MNASNIYVRFQNLGTLSEGRFAAAQNVRCSMTLLKRASAMSGTGGVVNITPSAESQSRDFGSTIFIIGEAGDHLSWRPAL